MESQKFWPTPVYSQMHKPVRPLAPSEADGTHGTMLNGAVGDADPKTVGGQLNPEFVNFLMGIPQGWLSLEPMDPAHWERWVAGDVWADGEWPGVPRVATGVNDRVNQLKMGGNGVVPECVAMFLRGVMA